MKTMHATELYPHPHVVAASLYQGLATSDIVSNPFYYLSSVMRVISTAIYTCVHDNKSTETLALVTRYVHLSDTVVEMR